MIYDLNQIVKKDHFDTIIYDFCIIGAGFAGITLALNLDKKYKVLLLEAGDYEYSAESQDMYKGKVIGHDYWRLEDSRIRCFGGTSNVWGRWAIPYEKRDFEEKPYAKLSGWPIKKKDLDPYLEQTNDIFEMSKAFKPHSHAKGWDDVLKKPNDDFEGFYITETPIDFKEKFGPQIKNSKNIDCYLNANVTDMTLSDDHSKVIGIEVKNYANKAYNPKAKTYVLATGGMENARLLLSFNKQLKNGIGNENGLVGKFFGEHHEILAGKLILEDEIVKSLESKEYNPEYKFLRPTDTFMKEHEILNFGIRIDTAKFLKRSTRGTATKFKEKVLQVVCSSEWLESFYNTYYNKGSKACIFHPNRDELFDGVITMVFEQGVNPLSMITLDDTEKDMFGMKRIVFDWQFLDIDKDTAKKGTLAFAKMFAERNLGRVKVDPWVLEDNKTDLPGMEHGRPGLHHMCTTRMSHTPIEGVVDLNQKVFGIDNLYIGGSSVFSTGGEVNPTFTIVQMTLRLADHLNAK